MIGHFKAWRYFWGGHEPYFGWALAYAVGLYVYLGLQLAVAFVREQRKAQAEAKGKR